MEISLSISPYFSRWTLHYYRAKFKGDFMQYLCLTRSMLTAHHIERFQRFSVTGFNGNRLLLDLTLALRICRITGGRQNGSVKEYKPFPRPWPGKHRRERCRVSDMERNVLMASVDSHCHRRLPRDGEGRCQAACAERRKRGDRRPNRREARGCSQIYSSMSAALDTETLLTKPL